MDRNVILHGIHDPLPVPVKLKAGPLDAVYESGKLRNISLGKNEVAQRRFHTSPNKRQCNCDNTAQYFYR